MTARRTLKNPPKSRLSIRDWLFLSLYLLAGGTVGYSALLLCIHAILLPSIVRESALRISKYTVLVENLISNGGSQSLPKGVLVRPEYEVISREAVMQPHEFERNLSNSLRHDFNLDRKILRDQKPLVDIWGGHWVQLKVSATKETGPKRVTLWLYYPERLSTSLWYLPVLRIFSILIGCLVGLVLYLRIAIEQPLALIISKLESNQFSNIQPLLAIQGSHPLRKLSKSINTLLDRINTTARVRRELIQGLTHDLGGPHSRLMLRTEKLAQHVSGSNQLLAAAMLSDLQQLRLITEQLAQLGESEIPDQARQTCALDALCNRVVGSYEKAMISLDVPRVMIRVNSTGLERALGNLIDNALEHGRAPITISAKTQNSILYLRVQDRGKSMSSLAMEQVTEKQLHLDQSRMSHRGLGLGIVNRFCLDHGGELKLTKRLGGGLCAELQIPILASARKPFDHHTNKQPEANHQAP
jgi:signal transduction histidine kinase